MAYAVPPSGNPEFALFYQSTNEDLGTATTNIIGLDTTLPGSSPIITRITTASPDETIFEVNASGIYQLEGHITVIANGATWSSMRKTIAFNVVRAGSGANAVLINTSSQISPSNYAISAIGSFILFAGDQITFVHTQAGVTGNPQAVGVTSTFDLNTWCAFTFIKSI
jgi:hypothetical protein